MGRAEAGKHCVIAALDIYDSFHLIHKQTSWAVIEGVEKAAKDKERRFKHTSLVASFFSHDYKVPSPRGDTRAAKGDEFDQGRGRF
jgi:hypothetical protein